MAEKDNAVEETVKELLEDPDAPRKGNGKGPAQTIEAEPALPDKDAR